MALRPVPRALLLVSDGDDENAFAFNAVDDAERKPPQNESACSVDVFGLAFGSLLDAFDRVVERSNETLCDRPVVVSKAQPCGARLRFGGGMQIKTHWLLVLRDPTTRFSPRHGLDLAAVDSAKTFRNFLVPRSLVLGGVQFVVIPFKTSEKVCGKTRAIRRRQAHCLVSDLRCVARHLSHSTASK